MKNLLKLISCVVVMSLYACGGDDCEKCSGTDPFFGIELESEACDNGDGTITVSATVAGVSQDTTYTGTLDQFVAENVAAGLSCD